MEQEKMKTLLENQEFVSGILEMETPEEVSAAFAKEGLTVTSEELVKAREQIAASQTNGELSETDLEDVSGGFLIAYTLATWAFTGGVTIGIVERITDKRW